jgi:hypothetical protein
MVLIKFVVLCFIVFLCASPSSELVVFDPGKWLYRTRSEGLTSYSCLSVLLPLRVRLGHLSWNNSGGSATFTNLQNVLQNFLRVTDILHRGPWNLASSPNTSLTTARYSFITDEVCTGHGWR